MNKYKIQKVWASSKEEAGIAIGFIRAFLGECEEGKWLIVITDKSCNDSEVLLTNTRTTAVKRIRERGFWSRMSKIYRFNI